MRPLAVGPLGGPLVYTALFCYQIVTLSDKKKMHYIFLLLFRPVLKLVYLSSEVGKKGTPFYIISILTMYCTMSTYKLKWKPLFYGWGLGVLNFFRDIN